MDRITQPQHSCHAQPGWVGVSPLIFGNYAATPGGYARLDRGAPQERHGHVCETSRVFAGPGLGVVIHTGPASLSPLLIVCNVAARVGCMTYAWLYLAL